MWPSGGYPMLTALGSMGENYPVLRPKDSVAEKMAMSKIHISKKWKLPPLRPKGSHERAKPSPSMDEGAKVSPAGDSPTGEDSKHMSGPNRKRLQNREAQRAYRERSRNKLQTLEDNVETLQGMVKMWQSKYKQLASEFDQYKQSSNEKIVELEKTISESKEDSKCYICMKNVDLDGLKENARNEDIKPFFQDEFLSNAIKNFQPMEAVSLKRKQEKNSSSPSITPRSSTTSFAAVLNDVDKGNCGFCNDNTACVCRDITSTLSAKPPQRRSDILLDTMSKSGLSTESIKSNYAVSALRSTHCSENPSKCTKCSDIDTSCLKSVPVDNKRSSIYMEELPMEFEVNLNDLFPSPKRQRT